MAEYTPDDESVRDCYVYGRWVDGDPERHFPEFDRWLTDLKRKWQAEALEAMADEGERYMLGATGERPPASDELNVHPRWHEIARLRARAVELRGTNEKEEESNV